MSKVVGKTGTCLGAEAWRTLISQVSNNCETEKYFGSFLILATSAVWTADKNWVALYSWAAMWQLGADFG